MSHADKKNLTLVPPFHVLWVFYSPGWLLVDVFLRFVAVSHHAVNSDTAAVTPVLLNSYSSGQRTDVKKNFFKNWISLLWKILENL